MDHEKLTFDDILKMGAEKGTFLLRDLVRRELTDQDQRTKALVSFRIQEMKRYNVEDMLKFLETKGGD